MMMTLVTGPSSIKDYAFVARVLDGFHGGEFGERPTALMLGDGKTLGVEEDAARWAREATVATNYGPERMTRWEQVHRHRGQFIEFRDARQGEPVVMTALEKFAERYGAPFYKVIYRGR